MYTSEYSALRKKVATGGSHCGAPLFASESTRAPAIELQVAGGPENAQWFTGHAQRRRDLIRAYLNKANYADEDA